ncbi:acyl carrier protein [Paenibacillus sp. SC116]|uniref:acyl carrier protein n=1 Tax=Paenibacillus sp. SC116 TaxID=2968986 RepID=UPI00215A9A16|nr:acyl carrier protein [Paenibacillus sp. SC116]MCR8843246.1 acyl carrier protein [Paenibacillus sp. SC116]
METTVESRIREIFKSYSVVMSEEELDTPLDELWGIDSITHVQILTAIAQEYHFKISDEDFLFSDLTTFNNIVVFVKKKSA